MKKYKVISRKNLPTGLPVTKTILFLMALDYYKAPQWLFGAVGCFLILGWIVSIGSMFQERQTDIFEEKE
jgi:hypothetical protein